MNIKEFLNNELTDYASYSTYRAIASYIDGLKNAQRKVIYTYMENNLGEQKVNRVAARVSEYSNYIHGETSLEQTIIGLAKNYTGSNNLPLLKREGNFGTRFIPEASATRYIYTDKEDYFYKIFRKEDKPILIEQYFEGDRIEPRFYVPIIPLILVNGSEGIATGFAQKILPRNIFEIIDYIECKLENKECNYKLLPYFNGFEGKVIQTDKNKYEVQGNFEVNGTLITITEVPIGYTYKSYKKVLDDLEDKKVIKEYKDLCDTKNDKFKFIIKVDRKFDKSNENIIKIFKLSKRFTENLTTIDENNKIRIFNDIFELLDAYIKIRLEYYSKRKEYQLNELQKELEFLKDKIKFIKAIIDGNIIINKKSKDEIIKQTKQLNIKYFEEHLKMQLWNLTKEKIEELAKQYKQKEKEYNELLNKSEKEIWLNELEELKNTLR